MVRQTRGGKGKMRPGSSSEGARERMAAASAMQQWTGAGCSVKVDRGTACQSYPLARLAHRQVLSGRQDENPFDWLAEMRPEVPDIACEEVRCACLHRSKQNRQILFGQGKAGRKLPHSCIKETNTPCQLRKPASLRVFGEVNSRLFQGVMGGAKNHVLELPEPEEPASGR
jgi:hypothetical protein